MAGAFGGSVLVLWVIFAHWVADFVCQTHWQASNKSKNWNALTRHVASYTAVMGAFCYPIFMGRNVVAHFAIFVVVTFAAHFVTDAITSRITSRLHCKGDWHNFFVVIGFDQFLHYTQLFLTVAWVVLSH